MEKTRESETVVDVRGHTQRLTSLFQSRSTGTDAGRVATLSG